MKRPLTAILLIVIAAAALGGGYYYWHTYRPAAQTQTKPATIVTTVTQTAFAATGTLSPTFPRALILASDAHITQSGVLVSPPTATTLATTTAIMTDYATASSSNDVLKAYIAYATAHSYPILTSELRPDGTRYIQFAEGNDVVSATITEPGHNSLNLVRVIIDKK